MFYGFLDVVARSSELTHGVQLEHLGAEKLFFLPAGVFFLCLRVPYPSIGLASDNPAFGHKLLAPST